MRDHDDQPYIVIERRSAGLAPFIWATIIGACAGLLLAPRAGAETQEEIKRGMNRMREAAEDRLDSARTAVDRTRSRIDSQLETVRDRVNTVRDRIESSSEHAKDAVDSGRRVARNARQEIERRLSDARETQQTTDNVDDMRSNPAQSTSDFDLMSSEITDDRSDGHPGQA